MNDDDLLRKWCKERNTDYTLARELKKKYYPLLEEACRRDGDKFLTHYIKHSEGTFIRLNNINTLSSLLENKLATVIQDLTPKERAVIFLNLQYLPMLEGGFSSEINFLILTLIFNEHDFYWRGNYVKAFKTIEKASLLEKFKFLKEHGFKFVTDKCDSKLRNSIAHLFYKVKDNGKIYVDGVEKDITLVHRNLRDITLTMNFIKHLYLRKR